MHDYEKVPQKYKTTIPTLQLDLNLKKLKK